MEIYLEVIVSVSSGDIELLESYLWNLEPEGIEERDNLIILFFRTDSIEKVTEAASLLNSLKEKGIIGEYSIDHRLLEDKNWNEEWEKSLTVIRVTDRVVIRPVFREYEAGENEIVLDIIPKMSFGTGEHETTKLMLQAVERFVKPGMRVLDVGSGTAVLAIAAIKFGAESAVAVDDDIWCKINGDENTELNNVENQVRVIHGTINDIDEEGFDCVLANIHKNVLIEIAPDIKNKAVKGGMVILSGLLKKDQDDILNIYTRLGFRTESVLAMDEWIAIVLKLD